MDNNQTLERLNNSNIRVVKKIEIPHPSEVISLISKIGKIKHVKYAGSTNGLDDNNEEIELINNYLVEVEAKGIDDEFYGICGVIVSQGTNSMKIYSGVNASACTNLQIFNSDFIRACKSIKLDELEIFLDKAQGNLIKHVPIVLDRIDRMKNTFFTSEEWTKEKGRLLSILPTDCLPNLLHAENLLRSDKSLYNEWDNSEWKMLSMMTDLVKNQSVTQRIKKTLQLEAAFN